MRYDSRSDASYSLPKVIYKLMNLRLNLKLSSKEVKVAFSLQCQEVVTGLSKHMEVRKKALQTIFVPSHFINGDIPHVFKTQYTNCYISEYLGQKWE